jgi:hypothetical protein
LAALELDAPALMERQRAVAKPMRLAAYSLRVPPWAYALERRSGWHRLDISALVATPRSSTIGLQFQRWDSGETGVWDTVQEGRA